MFEFFRGYNDFIQGADNKLGQFLNQDIYGTDNHRNILRHSLESCPSLVWHNINKPSLAIKYVGWVRNFCSCAKSFAHPHSKNYPVWLKASLKNHWSQEIWPPSSPGCNPLDYFVWCVFEREVNKQLQSILTSPQCQDLRYNDCHWQGGRHPRLQEVPVSDWGCCWGQWGFHWTNVYVICIQTFSEIFIQMCEP